MTVLAEDVERHPINAFAVTVFAFPLFEIGFVVLEASGGLGFLLGVLPLLLFLLHLLELGMENAENPVLDSSTDLQVITAFVSSIMGMIKSAMGLTTKQAANNPNSTCIIVIKGNSQLPTVPSLCTHNFGNNPFLYPRL